MLLILLLAAPLKESWKSSLFRQPASPMVLEKKRLDSYMDNGGAGMSTLRLMLMECDGKRIQLLPAWPADWTADFKLYAPYQTTVEGHVEHGPLIEPKTS